MPPPSAEAAASREFDLLNPSSSKSPANNNNYGSTNANNGESTEASLKDIFLRAPSNLHGSMMSMKSFIDEHTGESFSILVFSHR
jgi:hypothetical protein